MAFYDGNWCNWQSLCTDAKHNNYTKSLQKRVTSLLKEVEVLKFNKNYLYHQLNEVNVQLQLLIYEKSTFDEQRQHYELLIMDYQNQIIDDVTNKSKVHKLLKEDASLTIEIEEMKSSLSTLNSSLANLNHEIESQKFVKEKLDENIKIELHEEFQISLQKMKSKFDASIKILKDELFNMYRSNEDMVKQNEDLDVLLLSI